MNTVTVHIERPDPEASYVFDFICKIHGAGLESSLEPTGRVDIYYGNQPPAGLEISIQIPRNETDVVWGDLLEGRFRVEDMSGMVPFDVVNGIGALLTDRVNRGAGDAAFDEHDRLTFDGSFQSRSGYAQIPIVNRYVGVVQHLLSTRLSLEPKPLWPDGKRCAVALSHDVDAPIMHGASGGPLYDARASLTRNLLTNLYRARFSVRKLFGATGLEHWHFPFIMDAESFSGFKSTFMFAATRRFDRNGHPDFDVSYDVNTARFGDLFTQMNYRDFEIGLHAGYLSHRDSTHLESEKKKLEELAGVPVLGIRHHVWHTGRDVTATLERHETAGFEFDSSLAFNRRAVLRRSVALPYRPWSDRLGRAIDVIQIPVALMDGHIFYHPVTEDEARHQARIVVDSIRDEGGAGAIDWHVRTSSPDSQRFAVWGRTYQSILDYLSGLDDVWVTSLGEINDWIRSREKSID